MSAPTPSNAGTQLITADGVVGTSGQPVRVYAIHVISTGGGGAAIVLRNGTTTSGTIYIQHDGTTSKGTTDRFGTYGMTFPAGCFVDVDANTTSVLVTYSQ